MKRGSELLSGVLSSLPKDPNEQLAVAQKITEYAFSGRSEAETASLKSKLAEKDAEIESLQARVAGVETSLAEITAKLGAAMEGQAKLIKDKDVLSAQLKNATSQLSELDDVKSSLMKSLEVSAESVDDGQGEKPPCPPSLPCGSGAAAAERMGSTSPSSSSKKKGGPYSCTKADCSEPEKPCPDYGCPEDPKAPPVDGKEFFRQARNRLSYEKFSEFLTQVKALNAHQQTREETKKKSAEIFGPDNCDLTEKFNDLLSRYVIPPPSNTSGDQPAGGKPCAA